MIRVRGLRKTFGGLVAVNGIDMDVAEGEVLGVIGPNGSGKTTLINLLTGALRPDGGEVVFAGRRVTGKRPFQMTRFGMGRTFQLVRVMEGMTVRENVLTARCFGAAPTSLAGGLEETEELLDFVGLGDQADKLASELTYVDQKRLELARALAGKPTLLFLDEFLAGLNPTELQAGVELVARTHRRGITIVLVEHVMSAVRTLCHRVLVMNAGSRLATGDPETVLANPAVVKAYLGEADA